MGFERIDGRHKAAWNRRDDLDEPVLRLYRYGLSVLAIAKRLGVSRSPVQSSLRRQGIRPRGRSEAMTHRMASLSPDERKQLTREANEAVRGVPKSHAAKVRLARTRTRRIGAGELDLCEWLSEARIPFEHQAPVDIYNLDFLVRGNVAVELRVGRCHCYGTPRFREKVEDLLEAHTVVLIHARSVGALRACKDKLITDLDSISRDPAAVGQQWMVRCHEDRFARGRDELGRFTAEMRPVRFQYTRQEAQPS